MTPSSSVLEAGIDLQFRFSGDRKVLSTHSLWPTGNTEYTIGRSCHASQNPKIVSGDDTTAPLRTTATILTPIPSLWQASSRVLSRKHATITIDPSGAFAQLVDHDSSHGTRVSRGVSKHVPLPSKQFKLLPGDIVKLGKELKRDGQEHKPLYCYVIAQKRVRSSNLKPPTSSASGIIPSKHTPNHIKLTVAEQLDAIEVSSDEDGSGDDHDDDVQITATSIKKHINESPPASQPGPMSGRPVHKTLPASPNLKDHLERIAEAMAKVKETSLAMSISAPATRGEPSIGSSREKDKTAADLIHEEHSTKDQRPQTTDKDASETSKVKEPRLSLSGDKGCGGVIQDTTGEVGTSQTPSAASEDDDESMLDDTPDDADHECMDLGGLVFGPTQHEEGDSDLSVADKEDSRDDVTSSFDESIDEAEFEAIKAELGELRAECLLNDERSVLENHDSSYPAIYQRLDELDREQERGPKSASTPLDDVKQSDFVTGSVDRVAGQTDRGEVAVNDTITPQALDDQQAGQVSDAPAKQAECDITEDALAESAGSVEDYEADGSPVGTSAVEHGAQLSEEDREDLNAFCSSSALAISGSDRAIPAAQAAPATEVYAEGQIDDICSPTVNYNEAHESETGNHVQGEGLISIEEDGHAIATTPEAKPVERRGEKRRASDEFPEDNIEAEDNIASVAANMPLQSAKPLDIAQPRSTVNVGTEAHTAMPALPYRSSKRQRTKDLAVGAALGAISAFATLVVIGANST